MTAGATIGFALALGLVLGLFGLVMRVLRRLTGTAGPANGRLPMAVLQRVALGPRQGLALVRVGARVLVVSVGDGGVRAVAELSEQERALLQDASQGEGLEQTSFAAALARAAGGARERLSGLRVARGALTALLPLLLAASAASAQAAPARQQLGAARAAVSASGAQTPAVSGDAVLDLAAGAAKQLAGGAGPKLNLQLGDGDASDLRLSGTVGTVLFLGMLAMLPTLLLLMTSFTRVLIVLHFLRQALGTQNAPPAHLLAALALLLTGFIMAPTLADVNSAAVQPWMNGQIDEGQMMRAGVTPFRAFMLDQTPEADLARFVDMSGQDLPETAEQVSLPVLMAAFATHELKAAFQMGFALFLPFVIIDLVVSSVLTSMGMFMLPPTMIALPCKLLLFVLVDGWSLIVGSLVASFR